MDKIDTLKEFIIRTIKRNKEEKEKIKILDDITFQVYEGEKLGILGFNGAGKSTLLKVITGIYEPTEGYIKKYGKIAPLLALGAGFDKNYTGKNNIYLNGAFLGLKESFIKEKYDEIVEYSELGEFINYPIKNYSSGMRAKLGFSIATLAEPDILIIDEILSVGDVKFKQKSSEKINSMMEDGVTVILVSHSISQIKKICNRCIWLEDGKIAMQGDVDAVCDAYLSSAAGKAILILVIGFSGLYYIVGTSTTVGSAIVGINSFTLTVPDSFNIENNDHGFASLINRQTKEYLVIKDLGKNKPVDENFDKEASSIESNENYMIINNTTENYHDMDSKVMYYKTADNNTLYKFSVFTKFNHTFSIRSANFLRVDTLNDKTHFVMDTLNQDYKKSQN